VCDSTTTVGFTVAHLSSKQYFAVLSLVTIPASVKHSAVAERALSNTHTMMATGNDPAHRLRMLARFVFSVSRPEMRREALDRVSDKVASQIALDSLHEVCIGLVRQYAMINQNF
jgi:hypothetical protein